MGMHIVPKTCEALGWHCLSDSKHLQIYRHRPTINIAKQHMMAKLVGTWQACSHTVSDPILLKLGWLGQDGMQITTNSTPCCRGKGSTLQLFGNDEIHVSERRQCWWELSWHFVPMMLKILDNMTYHRSIPKTPAFPALFKKLVSVLSGFSALRLCTKFKQANAACLEPITRETDWHLTKKLSSP